MIDTASRAVNSVHSSNAKSHPITVFMIALVRRPSYANSEDRSPIRGWFRQILLSGDSLSYFMPHKMFLLAHQNCPLGYLIAIPKAVYILLNHKSRDSRVRLFLVQWAGALLAIFGAGLCGFSVMPTSIAASVFAPVTCFFAFLVWLNAGDIFLEFALEDEGFYDLATKTHALSVFLDPDQLPSSRN